MKTHPHDKILALGLLANVFLIASLFVLKQPAPIAVDPQTQTSAAEDADGLVAYWSFDEGSGTTATDYSGSGNNGTLVNSPTWTTGKSGTGLSFDGLNDRVDVGSDIFGTGATSISVWIYPRSFGQITAGIIENGKTSLRYEGNYRVGFMSDGTSGKHSGSNSVQWNQWYHVVATRDASGITNFYLNGSPAGVVNQNSGTPVAGSPVKIGNTLNGFHTFDGIIDELRVYNKVLTSSEVSSLYNAGNSGTPSSPSPSPVDPGPTAVNGMCSTTLNTCSAGTFSDQTDTSTQNLWQCVGSNGGTTASCSSAITQSQPAAVTPVNGVYTVNANGGTNAFTTIKACADVVTAGQTCRVESGTYDEKVTPKYSGTAGNPIIFEANGNVKLRGFYLKDRSHIRVSGFEMTNLGLTKDAFAAIFLESSRNIQIYNNNIHDTVATCIRFRGQDPGTQSNNNHIKGNTISKCGGQGTVAGIGIDVFGNYNLVENNDISHIGDDFTRVTGGDYNVLRNNIWRDNSLLDSPTSVAHIDGMQNWCSTSMPVRTKYLLIENNQMYNNPSPDTHLVIFQNYALCDNSNFIVRYNTSRNEGDYVLINDEKTKGVMLYNNTFSDTSIAGTRPWNAVGWTDGSSYGKLINNIFNNTTKDGGYIYSVSADSQPFDAHNNLAYNPGTTQLFGNPIKSEVGAVLGKDPLFVSSTNLALQSSSPAIEKGGYLTKVSSSDSGSGSTLQVVDASPFQDGWVGVEKDWIAVGSSGNVAQISSINYGANTITLTSSISRQAGDSVWLYRDSSGRQVLYGNYPDIGAYEYPGSVATSPSPTPTTPKTGDFNGDGEVNTVDFSSMSSSWGTSNSTYDLNNDGVINSLDYSLLVRNWTL